MSVLFLIAGLFIGTLNYAPSWYDSGPYEMKSNHANLSECQAVKGDDEICVNNEPALLYQKRPYGKMPEFSVHEETWKTGLDWAECDYWAGCYWGEK